MLTLPESPAAREITSVWRPAESAIAGTVTSAHVFQSAVFGSVIVARAPPSIASLSVRVVFCPSPPRLLA